MYVSPWATTSRRSVMCGDASDMAPTFCAMSVTCANGIGSRCSMVACAPEYVTEYANCTSVGPGGYGPATATRRPFATARGVDPVRTLTVLPFSGVSNTTGCGKLTAVWLLL